MVRPPGKAVRRRSVTLFRMSCKKPCVCCVCSWFFPGKTSHGRKVLGTAPCRRAVQSAGLCGCDKNELLGVEPWKGMVNISEVGPCHCRCSSCEFPDVPVLSFNCSKMDKTWGEFCLAAAVLHQQLPDYLWEVGHSSTSHSFLTR